MAAQVDLLDRRQPAQPEAVALRRRGNRLRKVILQSDGLHGRIVGQSRQRAYRSRVGRKEAPREGIDLGKAQVGHVCSQHLFREQIPGGFPDSMLVVCQILCKSAEPVQAGFLAGMGSLRNCKLRTTA
jgi:hypothetical protein